MRIREKSKNRINPRKGKCLPGREIIKPNLWSNDLVHIIAHFMFDGRVSNDSCIYYSKDIYQINHMKQLLCKMFRAKPKIQLRDNSVYGLTIYHVELAAYIRRRKEELFAYLNNGASKLEKRIFLKAFFDDEGNVFYRGDKRRVRGYQKSPMLLEQVRNLLSNFEIGSKINKDGTNIEVSGYCNLIKFANEINFSPKIYINPKRRNGIWKKRISKRRILSLLLKSYQRRE
ncbi:MAG: LAGLIDADG family homing endonuclease [Candidatus Omnitrophota bacterium]